MSGNNSEIGRILGELGTIRVTYELSSKGWDVFRQINEVGFDLLVRKGLRSYLVEVKSRDLIRSQGKNAKYVTVGRSKAQQKRSDFLAVYLYGPGTCFMIPSALPIVAQSKSRNSISLGKWENNEFSPREEFLPYIEKFDI